MTSDFNYIGFEPSAELERSAERTLERLMAASPYGSMAVAMLEKTEDIYECAIEIYSRNGSIIARASSHSPSDALDVVSKSLARKIKRWKVSRRFSSFGKRTQPGFSVA